LIYKYILYVVASPATNFPIFIEELDTYRRRYKSSAAGAFHNTTTLLVSNRRKSRDADVVLGAAARYQVF
jgi:hypothetical protein